MQRLSRKSDIERVFREGRRFAAPAAVLHACLRSADPETTAEPRLTVIAGRRFRSAVERNRARRVLREASRVMLREAQEPWDLVLVARPATLDQPSPERTRDLQRLYQRAGLLPRTEVGAG